MPGQIEKRLKCELVTGAGASCAVTLETSVLKGLVRNPMSRYE